MVILVAAEGQPLEEENRGYANAVELEVVRALEELDALAEFLASAVMDLGDPLYAARNYNKVSLASFENYKMDMLKSPDEKQAWVPDDETLKVMYEAEKDDVIRRVRHDSMRSLYINAVLIIICIVLFLTHWRWMRRVGRKYNTA